MNIINNTKSIFSKSKLAVAMTLLFAVSVTHATDGTINSTSTGDTDITVTIDNSIVINDVDPLSATWSGTGTLQLTDDVCVGTNSATGYTITASGDGTSNAFTLANGADTLVYSVAWAATAAQTTGEALITTAASTTQTTAQDLNCVANSATVIVDIAEVDLLAANAGVHTGTLTLLVTPL